jgi:ribosome maturation protein Sdo1
LKIVGGKDIAKKQAQLIIKEMQEKGILPIERAKMRIRISATEEIIVEIKTTLEEKYAESIYLEDSSPTYMIVLIAPFLY